jgi:hypothetical protein
MLGRVKKRRKLLGRKAAWSFEWIYRLCRFFRFTHSARIFS